MKVFLCILFALCSGCVASSQHVKRGDVLSFKNAENFEKFLEYESKEKPELKPLAENQGKVVEALGELVQANPAPLVIQAAGDSVEGYLQGGGITALILGAGALIRGKMKGKAVQSLVSDLINEPDQSKREQRAKGVSYG